MMLGDYPPGVTGRELALNGIPAMWLPDDCCRYCCRCAICGKEEEEDTCCDAYEWNGELLELPKKPAKPVRSNYLSEFSYQVAVSLYQKECRAWYAARHEEV